MKLYRSLLASALFLALLVAIYYVHVAYLPVNVVFYSALMDGALACIVAAVIMLSIGYFSIFNAFEKLLLIIIWALTSYSMAISIPAVIDRSLSFYILEKLQQRGGGIRQDRFDDVFTQEYMHEHRLVDVRLTEQLESGTIIIRNGCVLLTPKGEQLASFGRYFRAHWLPKQRLLMGQYSADLTNPFRDGKREIPDYLCSAENKDQ